MGRDYEKEGAAGGRAPTGAFLLDPFDRDPVINHGGGIMNKNHYRILKYIVCGVMCIAWLPAYAAWQPTLVSGEQTGYLRADEVIRLQIPADVSIEELQRLVMELDAIDVTAMVQREGEYALYKPLQPLTPGRHELRVVEYGDDGSILELGFWSFEVRQSRLFREYAVSVDTQLTANYRVADNNLDTPPPDRLQGQGSSQVSYSAANGDWHTNGEFDLLYNSNRAGQTNTRELDGGEFLFSAGNSYVDAYVGHQTVGTANLVMDNFRRRGVSLQGRMAAINSQVSGFLLSSEAETGFQRGLAIGDADRRVEGITFESSPLKKHPQALYLSGTWLEGHGRDSTGVVASVAGVDPGQASGRAWSLGADSLFMDTRLRLRAEYAGTDYDFSTKDILDSNSDTAYSLLVVFTDTTAANINWNLGIESREIGTFFKSLANQALPSDRHLDRLFAGAQRSTMGMQASYERQTDNVNDTMLLPRIRTELSSLSLNWSPVSAADWLGAPSLAASASHQLQSQTFTPSGFLLSPTDNNLDSLQLSGMFSYALGNWGLTMVNSQFRDHASVQDDTNTNGVYFDSSLVLLQHRLNLLPTIHFDRTEDKDLGQTSTAVTYGLGSSLVIIPDNFDASLNISLNRNRTSDDSLNKDTLALNMAFNWHILAAGSNRPGFDMGISAMYNNLDDKVLNSNSIDIYQAFLTLSMVLPVRAGQVQ